MLIGAHPDDCEINAGGVSARWAAAGFNVVLVSMTNGDAGHHDDSGPSLAARRKRESEQSAQLADVESVVLDCPDGTLEPTLSTRKQIVGLLREHEADLVVTHRPNDYHPDHRYTAQCVQDAAYMVTVPHFLPEAKALTKNPVFAYFCDRFKKPYPFHADVAVDVGEVMATKWRMLDAMESQVYEWLPWHEGALDAVPKDAEERMAWLQTNWTPYFERVTSQGREALEKRYGLETEIRFAELFELSEYGHQPDESEIRALFPFFPEDAR